MSFGNRNVFARDQIGGQERLASGMTITTTITGFDTVIKAIKNVSDEATKRRRLIAILKQQAKPYLRALLGRGAIRDRSRWGDDWTHTQLKEGYHGPGQLRASMRMFANKKNLFGYVAVHVGPKAKKPEGSGFYGYFLLPGVADNIQKGERDWKEAAFRYARHQIEKGLADDLRKYLKRTAKKYKWHVE